MGWLIGYNDLDKEQRLFLDGGRPESGAYVKSFLDRQAHDYIQGFPGCGKTVLLVYAVGATLYHNPKAKIIIVEFTHALIKMLEAALSELRYKDKAIDTSNVHVITYYDFVKNSNLNDMYDLILCDEVQDVPQRIISLMKERGHRVVVAGDHNQSIYKEDPKWHLPLCKAEELTKTINPEVTTLRIMHRLCRSIVNAVGTFMPDMNIMSGRIPMIKQNVQIRLWHAKDQAQETEYIIQDAIETININESVGVLLKNHQQIVDFANYCLFSMNKPTWLPVKNGYGKYDLGALNKHLHDNGVPMQYVANGYGNFLNERNLITITTYKSAKGLDFDKVFLPFCTNDCSNYYGDLSSRVFMVAMTRSRSDLIISYSGILDSRVELFQKQCLTTNLGEATNNIANSSSDDIDFGF